MKRIAFFAVVCAAGLCLAADPGAPGPAAVDEKPLKVSELTYQQQFVRGQFERLTRLMVEVAQALEKTEPQSAQAIYRAVAEAKAADIDANLAKVVEHLQAGLTAAAGGAQEDAVGGLRRVLDLLVNGPPPFDPDTLKKFRDEAKDVLARHRGDAPPSKGGDDPKDSEKDKPTSPTGGAAPKDGEKGTPSASTSENAPKGGEKPPVNLPTTAGKTEDLAGRMRSAGTPDRPIPGAAEVGKAGEAMRREIGELSRRQEEKARASGDEAERQLRRAIDLLDAAIAEEGGRRQDKALADLAETLQKALDDQQRISRETRETYARRRDGGYDRAADLALTGQGDGEKDLSKRIEEVRQNVLKEGTTKVFPVVLGEVGTDLESAGRMLANRQAGPVTQSVQKDIEENLASMIAALKAEQQRRNRRPTDGHTDPRPTDVPPTTPPLVPPVAELKMLRTLQGQINSRTAALDAERQAGEVPAPELKARHEIVAQRQRQTEEMTRQLGEATR